MKQLSITDSHIAESWEQRLLGNRSLNIDSPPEAVVRQEWRASLHPKYSVYNQDLQQQLDLATG